MGRKEKNETDELLRSINEKLKILILLHVQGKEKEERIKILKSYKGNLSKRELEKITGVNRNDI